MLMGGMLADAYYLRALEEKIGQFLGLGGQTVLGLLVKFHARKSCLGKRETAHREHRHDSLSQHSCTSPAHTCKVALKIGGRQRHKVLTLTIFKDSPLRNIPGEVCGHCSTEDQEESTA